MLLLCAEANDALTRPYAELLQQKGFRVLEAALFHEQVLQTVLPSGLDPGRYVTVVPSPRAAMALAQQPWFESQKTHLRAITPGRDTARVLSGLGVEPIWSAQAGFRSEPLPAPWVKMPKLYLGNAALAHAELAFDLGGASDRWLPVYRRRLHHRAPWTPFAARMLSQADHLTVLALSPSQRSGFEAALTKLEIRRPRDLRLVSLTSRTTGRFSAKFWTEIAVPPQSNRKSLLELLQDLFP